MISGRNHQSGFVIFMLHRKPFIERMERRPGRDSRAKNMDPKKISSVSPEFDPACALTARSMPDPHVFPLHLFAVFL